MNIPYNISRTQFFSDNILFQQTLGKKYYKSINKSKKISETAYLLYNESNFFQGRSYREEVLSWLFSLSEKDKVKALTIENKWLATIIIQMHNKYKSDNKIKFQQKSEFSDEEYYMHSLISPVQAFNYIGANNEISLENYFVPKQENNRKFLNNKFLDYCNVYYSVETRDLTLSEQILLSQVVVFSVKEENDSIGLSVDFLNDKKLFLFNFDKFSGEKCFSSRCSIKYESGLKYYIWNMPEWLKTKDFTLPEYLIACFEQVLCVRYWYYKEESIENSMKNSNNYFSLTEDSRFNEMYSQKNKIIDYLDESYPDYTLFKKVDLNQIVEETKNDPSTFNKFYLKVDRYDGRKPKPKLDIFDQQHNYNYEITQKVLETYYNTNKNFINQLVFISLEKINTLEDLLYRKIFVVLLNLYAEKNALDLIEDINLDIKNHSSSMKPIGGKSKKKKPKIKPFGSNLTSLNIKEKSDKELIVKRPASTHKQQSNINNNSIKQQFDLEIRDKFSDFSKNTFGNRKGSNIEFIDLNEKESHSHHNSGYFKRIVQNNYNSSAEKNQINSTNFSLSNSILNVEYENSKSKEKSNNSDSEKQEKHDNCDNISNSKALKLSKSHFDIKSLHTFDEKFNYVDNLVNCIMNDVLSSFLPSETQTFNISSNLYSNSSISSKPSNYNNSIEDIEQINLKLSNIDKLIKGKDKSIEKAFINKLKNFKTKSNNSNNSNNNSFLICNNNKIEFKSKVRSNSLILSNNISYNIPGSSRMKIEQVVSTNINGNNRNINPSNNKLNLVVSSEKIELNSEKLTQKDEEKINKTENVINNYEISIETPAQEKEKDSKKELKEDVAVREALKPEENDEEEAQTGVNQVVFNSNGKGFYLYQTKKPNGKKTKRGKHSNKNKKNEEKENKEKPKEAEKPKLDNCNNLEQQANEDVEENNKTMVDSYCQTDLKKQMSNVIVKGESFEQKKISEGKTIIDLTDDNTSINNSNNNSHLFIEENKDSEDYFNQNIQSNNTSTNLNANNNNNNSNNNLNNTNNKDNKSNNLTSGNPILISSQFNRSGNSHIYNQSLTGNSNIMNGNTIYYNNNNNNNNSNMNNNINTQISENTNVIIKNNYNKNNFYNNKSNYINDNYSKRSQHQIKRSSNFDPKGNYQFNNNIHNNNNTNTNINNNTPNNSNSSTPITHSSFRSVHTPHIPQNLNINNSISLNNPNNNKLLEIYNKNTKSSYKKSMNNHYVNNNKNLDSGYKFYSNKSNNFMFNSWRKANSSKFENNLLNKIITDETLQCTFYHKLHNDILDYSFKVKEILDFLKPAKDFVIELIKLTINQAVDQVFENEIYGSYATDLSIESSDVDILIKIDQDYVDLDNLINKICVSFASLKVIDSINPIATASIPVIKLVIDPIKLLSVTSNYKTKDIADFILKHTEIIESYKKFLTSDSFLNYDYCKAELTNIKIDLSFVNPTSYNHNVVDYIKNQILINPEITPITHVLKRYLTIKKLNSCFNGGLASYSLLLMIIAYLRYPKTSNITNLGSILIGFLEFYGKYFSFNQFVIDITNFNPILMTNEYLDGPIIIDPITRKNVAKNSFRIDDVKDALGQAFDFLQNIKIQFDKGSSKFNEKNFIMDLNLKS